MAPGKGCTLEQTWCGPCVCEGEEKRHHSAVSKHNPSLPTTSIFLSYPCPRLSLEVTLYLTHSSLLRDGHEDSFVGWFVQLGGHLQHLACARYSLQQPRRHHELRQVREDALWRTESDLVSTVLVWKECYC